MHVTDLRAFLGVAQEQCRVGQSAASRGSPGLFFIFLL